MMGKAIRTEEVVRTFDVFYDDTTNTVDVNMTTVTEVTTGRGREYSGDTREYFPKVLELTLPEFERLMRAGLSTLTYQIGLVQRRGVRVDHRTEKLATPLAETATKEN